MANDDEILVANLKDALQQTQRYVLYGILSAALLVLLSLDAPRLISVGQQAEVPIAGKVDPTAAAIIFTVGYLAFGILASLALARIRKIAAVITDARIVNAVLTHFCLPTIDNRAIRVAAALLAPVVLLTGYLLEKHRASAAIDALGLTLGLAALATPYVVLAYRLLKPPIGAASTTAAGQG